MSDLQRDYLRMVVAGYTSKEIALHRSTTPKAVDHQLDRARDALGAATRLQAARLLLKLEEGERSPGEPFPLSDLPPPVKLGGTAAGAQLPEPGTAGVQEAVSAFIHDLPDGQRRSLEEPVHDLAPTSHRRFVVVALEALVILVILLAVSALMREANRSSHDIYNLFQPG